MNIIRKLTPEGSNKAGFNIVTDSEGLMLLLFGVFLLVVGFMIGIFYWINDVDSKQISVMKSNVTFPQSDKFVIREAKPHFQLAVVVRSREKDSQEWISETFIESDANRIFEPLPSSTQVPFGTITRTLYGFESEGKRRLQEPPFNWSKLGISVAIGVVGLLLFFFAILSAFSISAVTLAIPISIYMLITGDNQMFLKKLGDKLDRAFESGIMVATVFVIVITLFVFRPESTVDNSLHQRASNQKQEPVGSQDWSSHGESRNLWFDNGENFPIRVVNMLQEEADRYAVIDEKTILLVKTSVGDGLYLKLLRENNQMLLEEVMIKIIPTLTNSTFIYNINSKNRYKVTSELYMN